MPESPVIVAIDFRIIGAESCARQISRGSVFFRGPKAFPGQRIGLLGGSFDPPHEGHVHITRWALRAGRLDRIWWLVSPGNPLKENGPANLDHRVTACRKILRDPRVDVTDIERHLGTSYTANTLRYLFERYPGVRFVWMMGSDNLAKFHRWEDWVWIIEHVPIMVLARPGEQLKAGLSPAARRYARLRHPPGAASVLGADGAPGWVMLTGPMSTKSSTDIRRHGAWVSRPLQQSERSAILCSDGESSKTRMP